MRSSVDAKSIYIGPYIQFLSKHFNEGCIILFIVSLLFSCTVTMSVK